MPKNTEDDFWDLDSIIPKKRSELPYITDAEKEEPDTEAVLICSEPKEPKKTSAPQKKLTPKSDLQKRKILSYKPQNALIHSVTVWDWPSKYNFYEEFRTEAVKYSTLTHESCPEVNFFSYIPQYSDMTGKQFAYYLWWRENARKGTYLGASYSYIILYVYEIINTSDILSPASALDSLCGIWLHYRTAYPHLDKYLCEWVCDFCLINALPLPYKTLSPIIDELINISSFREFYIDPDADNIPSDAVIRLCSYHRWEKCKEITDENRDYFRKHINGAMSYALKKYIEKYGEIANISNPTRLIRDAYSGSLCAYNVKRQIDIEYVSFSRTSSFRQLITDILKYSQNIVRSSLGIKSRFLIKDLPDDIKAAINEYFEISRQNGTLISRKKQPSQSETYTREYEALYEPEVSDFSINHAKDIESDAWRIADMLETDEFHEEPEAAAPAPVTDTADEQNDDDIICHALELMLLEEYTEFEKYSKSKNMLPEAMIQKINDAAYDRIGDIVIETNDTGAFIISDYTEEIKKWLNR